MLSNKLHLNYKPVQLVLPVDYEQIIDVKDSVISFKEVVGGLNLGQYIQTSSKGRQEYASEAMLHLILFGYMENIRSLSCLEKACRTDIRFMYLGNLLLPVLWRFNGSSKQNLPQLLMISSMPLTNISFKLRILILIFYM